MKLKLVLLIGMMSVMLLGCTKAEALESDKLFTNKETESESQITEEKEETEKSKIEFFYTHKAPGKEIVIDAPNYQNVELGATELYIIHDSRYVSFTFSDLEETNDLKEAHRIAYDRFLQMVENYSFGELTVIKEEYVTINGIDMYRYEGTIKEGYGDNKYDCYALGYSFIMDGVPCTVGGAVLEEAQSDELIKEIHDTVEAMIRTLRTER